MVEVGAESCSGKHRYQCPTKPYDWTNIIPGSLTYLWLKAGSSMVAQGFIQATSWKFSRTEDCTTSMGNLLYFCTVFKGKKVLFLASMNLSCSN